MRGMGARPTAGGDSLRDLPILLVDDDEDIRALIADILALHGARVTTAASGNEAFQAFRSAPPDLLLSDLWMPDGDGFELIKSVRACAPADGGLTPAIAFSAAGDVKSAMLAGYHAFLSKPFDFPTLLALVVDFRPPDCEPRLTTPWTIQLARPELLVIKLCGDLRAVDMVDLASALLHHLDAGPVDVIVDLQELVSFAPSVGSVGERAVWPRRRAIRSLQVMGGSFQARLVSQSACRILGIPFRERTEASASL
jgi:CheY-like chemotaxis protein